MIEYAQQSPPPGLPGRLDPQISAALGPAMSQIGMGQSFELVAEQEADVASRGLLLQEPEPQAGTVDRAGVLPAFEAMARPAPAIAPFRSTTLRWPGEIVSPLRTSISRASRVSVQSGPSAAGLLSTSRATAQCRLTLVRCPPGRGRKRSAATPPRATAARQRRTCSARTPRRWPIDRAALASKRPQHRPRPVRLGPQAERLSRSSSARPASFTINAHRRPMDRPARLLFSRTCACARSSQGLLSGSEHGCGRAHAAAGPRSCWLWPARRSRWRPIPW